MADPKAHEVIPQAIVKEIPVEGMSTIQAANLAKEVRKGIDKGNFREGLQRITEVQDVRYEEFAKKKTTFGVEINDNPQSPDFGKVQRSQEEEALLLRIQQFETVSKKFFEKGYDGLDNGEKTAIRAKIIEQARRLPQLAPQIERLIAAGQADNFAERYIKDPSFAAELKNKVNELLEQPFDNEILTKFEDYMFARQEMDIARAEIDEIDTKIDVNNRELAAFRKLPNGDPDPTARKATRPRDLQDTRQVRSLELEDLQQEIDDAQREVTRHEEEKTIATSRAGMSPDAINNMQLMYTAQLSNLDNSIQSIDAQLLAVGGGVGLGNDQQRLVTYLQNQRRNYDTEKTKTETAIANLARNTVQRDPVDIQQDIERARLRLQNAKTNFRLKKADEDEIKLLETEERQFEAQKSALIAEKRSIQERYNISNNKFTRAQRECLSAKEARLLDEKTYTEKMEASWGRASNEIISQQMIQAERIYGEELADWRKQSNSEHERVFLTTIQNTYLGPEQRRTSGFGPFRKVETARPLDKTKILQDYALLLKQGDVPLVRSLFARTINPDTGQNFTSDEIDDIFEKNPDLITKARPKAVKHLLARKAIVGGFTHEDAYILSTSEWGKNMIEKGLDQNNTEYGQTINQLIGAGALSRHGYKDRFKQAMSQHPFLWSLLLGIPAAIRARDMRPEDEQLLRQR